MASASPANDRIAGQQRAFTGEAFTFFGFGGTTKAATSTPGRWQARHPDPRPDRGGHHRSAAGDGRPS